MRELETEGTRLELALRSQSSESRRESGVLARTSLWLLAPCSALSGPWAQGLCRAADSRNSPCPLDPVTSSLPFPYQALRNSKRNSG